MITRGGFLRPVQNEENTLCVRKGKTRRTALPSFTSYGSTSVYSMPGTQLETEVRYLLVDPSLAFLLAQAYSKVYYKYLTTAAAAYITIDTSEL